VTKYHSCESLILLVALFCTAAARVDAGTISFFDGTFNDADWNNTKILDPGGTASFTAFQVGSGGDPGSFQETNQTITSTDFIGVSHLNTGFTYNPSVQGAITSVNFSSGQIEFSPLGGLEVGYSLLLFQDNTYYIAASDNLNESSWTTFSTNGLTASSFTLDFAGDALPGPGPAEPDFSSTGDPIEFGFFSGNTPVGDSLTTSSGIDNLSITLNIQSTPEPASVMLLTGGLAILAFVKWLRRGSLGHSRI